MKRVATVLLLVTVALCLAGCGNVYLQGDALTAAEGSTMDAYQAAQRVAQPPPAGSSESPPGAAAPQGQAVPPWVNAYLTENFKQWRDFVRSALKDTAWGPKLPSEADAQAASQPGQ